MQERALLGDLLSLNADEVRTRLELADADAAAVLQALRQAPAYEAALADMGRHDIGLIIRSDVAYPDLLDERLPEDWLPYYLYYRGNAAILTQPGLAVLGATRPGDPARTIAQDLARALVADGHSLVGGYDRGVDRLALDAAWQAGGSTVLVLPLGMNPFRQALVGMQKQLDEGRALVLSPYAPDVAHSEALATARRALLVALSEALYYVEPDDEPKDWPALVELLPDRVRAAVWQSAPASWTEAGATVFADVAEALRPLRALYSGIEGVSEMAAGEESLDGAALSEEDDLGEPIEFTDAHSAVEMLGRTGAVPDVLARRLAQRLKERAEDEE
jgi:hypothetical protein